MKMSNCPLITIDGPGATGKSTVAWAISKKLNLNFLNSGCLYRIAAYYVSQKLFELEEVEKISDQINKDHISFSALSDQFEYSICLNEEDITDKLKHDEIAILASKLSKQEILRRALVLKQQDFYQEPGLVADGRDMGTCIFPEAKFKFFLTASANVRAERRFKELQDHQINANFTEVLDSLIKRDEQDATRSVAPLVIPPEAVVIDTSQLSLLEVIDSVIDHCCIV
ncbi:MAG: (d)CMP kinase [Pseudomonadota bacterium]|nr:(d)CMP kinase [Pseudomonadota bacterium]